MPTTKIFVFDQDQLYELLNGTIEMFQEMRDHHNQTEHDAKPAAIREMTQWLESERELAAEDPEYIVTGQIIPTLLETTNTSMMIPTI